MRLYILLIISAGLLSACSRSRETGGKYDRAEEKIRKEVLTIAENYALNNVNDATKTILEHGNISIGNEEKMYIIDPAKIFIGCIDSDKKKDAIISVYPFRGSYEIMTEHLIIIRAGHKLMLIRSLESDMKVLKIEEGIITAEVPEYSRNSPLFDCPSCWEGAKFKYVDGELVRIE